MSQWTGFRDAGSGQPPPEVVSFQTSGPDSMDVGFSDGTHNRIDFSGVLEGDVFGRLRDPAFFGQASLDHGVLHWPNGASFDSEILYNWSKLRPEMLARAGRWRRRFGSYWSLSEDMTGVLWSVILGFLGGVTVKGVLHTYLMEIEMVGLGILGTILGGFIGRGLSARRGPLTLQRTGLYALMLSILGAVLVPLLAVLVLERLRIFPGVLSWLESR